MEWFGFKEYVVRKVVNGKFVGMGVDGSFVGKWGKKRGWIGGLWWGVGGEMKGGEEMLGVGVIEVEKEDCMRVSGGESGEGKCVEEME